MLVIGVDCDTNGAFAFVKYNVSAKMGKVTTYDIPVTTYKVNNKNRKIIDAPALRDLSKTWPLGFVYVEGQSASPQMGVTSSFGHGRTYGTVLMACNLLSPHGDVNIVRPALWKRKMGVTSDKKATVAYATSIAPIMQPNWKLVKHTSHAESFLIAVYGVIKETGHKIEDMSFERA